MDSVSYCWSPSLTFNPSPSILCLMTVVRLLSSESEESFSYLLSEEWEEQRENQRKTRRKIQPEAERDENSHGRQSWERMRGTMKQDKRQDEEENQQEILLFLLFMSGSCCPCILISIPHCLLLFQQQQRWLLKLRERSSVFNCFFSSVSLRPLLLMPDFSSPTDSQKSLVQFLSCSSSFQIEV